MSALLTGCDIVPRRTPPSGESTAFAPQQIGQGLLGLGGAGDEPDYYAQTVGELPTGLEWLNVDQPLTLAQLRGKIVLLDFWTYGCINCLHNFADLERLQEDYPDALVVIGVHSAKFEHEGQIENVRQIVARYGLRHPIVNDPRRRLWYEWGVQAWPTLVLLDPAGRIADVHVGEGVYEAFQPLIRRLVQSADARGILDRAPIALEVEGAPATALAFPAGLAVDPRRGRLFIADTGHHRVLVVDLESNEVLDAAGSGTRGLQDGTFAEARFARPRGLAASANGRWLYVADTGNHAVRRIDLRRRRVETLTGTGAQARLHPPSSMRAAEARLNAPWDLALDGRWLYISMTGAHQIWRLDRWRRRIGPYAGAGVEGVVNAPGADAWLAQPSGLALDDGRRLYFADAESSSIRYVERRGAQAEVNTLAGPTWDLFTFGDVDGAGSTARFQHPLGVAYGDRTIYVADTYNAKIKRVDVETGNVETVLGGAAGWQDGAEPRFNEPSDLDLTDGTLYVADTNNHVLRTVDLAAGTARTITLRGLERFVQGEEGIPPERVVQLSAVTVGPGEGRIRLEVALPAGYKMNDLAPSAITWRSSSEAIAFEEGSEQTWRFDTLPLTAEARFVTGRSQLRGDLVLFYCESDREGICLIEQVQLQIEVHVGKDSSLSNILVSHQVTLPQ
jgi:sugar lactone lactonase YvrE